MQNTDEEFEPLTSSFENAPQQPPASERPQPLQPQPLSYPHPHGSEPDPEAAAKHADSVHRYPKLDLSENEYVIQAVRRTPIGLIPIWFFIFLVLAILFAILPIYAMNRTALQPFMPFQLPSAALLSLPLLVIGGLLVVGGLIVMEVYRANLLYLTNESVILYVRASLFNTKLRIIGLVNIEDASADKVGIIQQTFNYGTIHLSTKGEDVSFIYAPNPQPLADATNDAIENARKKLEQEP